MSPILKSKMSFPAYVNGEPPVISIDGYDNATWAGETAVDSTATGYVAVKMDGSGHVVAKFDQEATATLDKIFKSAKKQYVQETVVPGLKDKYKKKV